jgi:hypothetical protein
MKVEVRALRLRRMGSTLRFPTLHRIDLDLEVKQEADCDSSLAGDLA